MSPAERCAVFSTAIVFADERSLVHCDRKRKPQGTCDELGFGEGVGKRVRQLPGIPVTRASSDFRCVVNNGNAIALLRQVIRGGYPDDTGADDDNVLVSSFARHAIDITERLACTSNAQCSTPIIFEVSSVIDYYNNLM
jgi:hypothetical protein